MSSVGEKSLRHPVVTILDGDDDGSDPEAVSAPSFDVGPRGGATLPDGAHPAVPGQAASDSRTPVASLPSYLEPLLFEADSPASAFRGGDGEDRSRGGRRKSSRRSHPPCRFAKAGEEADVIAALCSLQRMPPTSPPPAAAAGEGGLGGTAVTSLSLAGPPSVGADAISLTSCGDAGAGAGVGTAPATEEATPKKKGRGRPRKNSGTVDAFSVDSPPEAAARRKRGPPPQKDHCARAVTMSPAADSDGRRRGIAAAASEFEGEGGNFQQREGGGGEVTVNVVRGAGSAVLSLFKGSASLYPSGTDEPLRTQSEQSSQEGGTSSDGSGTQVARATKKRRSRLKMPKRQNSDRAETDPPPSISDTEPRTD